MGLCQADSLKRPKYAPLKLRVVILLFCPGPSSQDTEFHHLMATAAKAVCSPHIAHSNLVPAATVSLKFLIFFQSRFSLLPEQVKELSRRAVA